MVRLLTLLGALLASSLAHAVPFSYAGPPVAIPDALDFSGAAPGARVGAPVNVVGIAQPVGTVTVSIDGVACSTAAGDPGNGIDHTFVNDLRITLRSPAGTEVVVISNTDGGSNNFCQVLLSDASAGPNIQTAIAAQAPFTGSWLPNAPLSAFAGEVANGAWTLFAQDFFASDTGTIRAWTVDITPAAVVVPPAPPASVPTLSEWALILLASLMAGVAAIRIRRNR